MTLSKTLLDKLVKNHNGQDDQVWDRTLATKHPKNGGIEVLGLDNYGNLYFVQVDDDERVRIDWIRKGDIGDKYSDVMPEHLRVNDCVLDKFRQELKASGKEEA